MKTSFLMTPGPTQVPTQVSLAMAQEIIHHRQPEFGKLLQEITEKLKFVFQTQGDVLIFPGAGTGALEGAVVNFFSPGDKVVFGVMGEFGSRWAKIAEIFGLQAIRLGTEWGKAVTAQDLDLLLESEEGKGVKAVFITHNETSTGVYTNLEEIGKVCQKHKLLFLVDAVSSLAAIDLKTDQWGVDVVVTASQKALMTPPGLCFFSVSEKAWAFNREATCPRYYWDLAQAKKYLERKLPQNPYTPAVTLLFGLNRALDMIQQEGLEQVFARHLKLTRMLRRGVEAMGLELLVKDEDIASPSVTAIVVPPGVEASNITSFMRESGVIIAGGQAELKGKIVRVGHMGYFDAYDIANTLTALGRAFQQQNVSVDLGQGLQKAWEVYNHG